MVLLDIIKETKKLNCKICGQKFDKIFVTEKSVAVNNYDIENKHRYKSQTGLYCEECQYFYNSHDWTLSELFNNYTYRSPDSYLLDPIVLSLANHIKNNDIETVVEIGGNTGLFLSKLKELLPAVRFINVDLWHETDLYPNVENVDLFLGKHSSEILGKLKPDLVICRHILAHNADIFKLINDLVEQLDFPKFIYIENADFQATFENYDFGQLYAEHFYAFTSHTLEKLFSLQNYSLTYKEAFEIHNGSFGLLFQPSDNGTKLETYHKTISTIDLLQRFEDWKHRCLRFAKEIEERSGEIAVVAISAKFIFTANGFLPSSFRENISMIFDTTESKIGKIPTGFNSPITSQTELPKYRQDLSIIVGARNFEMQISEKLNEYGFSDEQIIIPPF